MNRRLWLITGTAFLGIGCLTSGREHSAFTDEWHDRQQGAQAEARRKAKEQEARRGVRFGADEGAMRGRLYLDEKGKPRLGLGESDRVSTDVDVDYDELGFEFKYKVPLSGPREGGRDLPVWPPPDE